MKSLTGLRGATKERVEKVPSSLDHIAKPFDKQFNIENPIKIYFRKFINICLYDKNDDNSLNTMGTQSLGNCKIIFRSLSKQ